jgi:hypothetical protein
MPVVEHHAEHQIGKRLFDDALKGELLFDGHGCHLRIRWDERSSGAAGGRRALGRSVE